MPWRRERIPTPVFLPGKSHGQRSLVGFSPWGHRVRPDLTTKQLQQTYRGKSEASSRKNRQGNCRKRLHQPGFFPQPCNQTALMKGDPFPTPGQVDKKGKPNCSFIQSAKHDCHLHPGLLVGECEDLQIPSSIMVLIHPRSHIPFLKLFWFFPRWPSRCQEPLLIRDSKLSPQGTHSL